MTKRHNVFCLGCEQFGPRLAHPHEYYDRETLQPILAAVVMRSAERTTLGEARVERLATAVAS